MPLNPTDLRNQETLKYELQNEQTPSQFEQLGAALLDRFIDVWFPVAKRGSQHGADAGTAGQQGRRLRAECKRYRDTKPLSDRELLGEIDEALARDEALEAWILAATRPVPEQTRQSVVQHGEKWGIPIVIIDWTDNGIAPLAALCAFAPDLIEHLFSEKGGEAARALKEASAGAVDRLKRDLESWCLGFESLRSQAHDKLKKIWESPAESNAALGQDVAGGNRDKKVKRNAVQKSLDDWWQGETPNDAPAAVIGFEGTGKTWAVLDWLIHEMAKQPIILVVPSSAVPYTLDFSESSLKEFFAARLQDISGSARDREHWHRRLDRLLESPLDEGPVLTVVWDGLNQEYPTSWPRLFKTLQAEPFSGRVRAIFSTRMHHFENKLSRLKGLSVAPVIVQVDRYNSDEIEKMLDFEGLTPTMLPPDLLELARTPRLFNLVVRFWEKGGGAAQMTVHRLLWEYGRDTLGTRSDSFSEQDWKEWLQEIAQKCRDGITDYSTKTLSKTVNRPDLNETDVYRRLSDIIDGRFATPSPSGRLQIIPQVVAHALGLALLEKLDVVTPSTRDNVEDQLHRWLEPISGLDQATEILRAAVSIRIEQGQASSSPVPGVLLTTWLQALNVTDEHRQEVVDLAPNFPGALLDVIEHSESYVHESARAWAVKSLREIPKSNNATLGAIVESACRWLAIIYRNIHTGTGASQTYNKQRSEQLTERVGTDAPGHISILGNPLQIDDQSPHFAKASIPTMLQDFPLSKALPVFEAAAIEQAVAENSQCWESLEWLCLLNEVDPQQTATGLRNLAEEICQRVPDPGIHSELPKRIAALLLGLTGQPVDEENGAALEPHIGGRPRYEEDYLSRPSRSFWFPLERRHAGLALIDNGIVLHRRVEIVGDLWLDPDFEPPEAFVAELRNEVARFDVAKLDSNRWQTREDIRFAALEPALARCAPDLLANLIHGKLQSLATCPPESRYSKAITATDYLVLAGETERAAAKELRSNLSENDRTNQLAAENWLAITEIRDLDARQQIDMLIRAELQDFLVDCGEALRPLSAPDVEELIRCYATGSQKQQLDLFKLLSFQPEHICLETVWPWVEGMRSSHSEHRGFIFKTLTEADLMRFGHVLLEEEWSWNPAQDVWVNHYGTDALIEASLSLPLEELVPRLAPWRLLEAARRRGADPAEVRLAAEVFSHALLAHGVEELDPGADLSVDRTQGGHQPFRYSVQARQNNDGHKSLLTATHSDPDNQLQASRRAIDTAARRIREARGNGAKLFQAILAVDDFEPVLRYARNRVEQWLEGCSETEPTREFQHRVLLAEGVFLALCEALLTHDPEQGSRLCRALWLTFSTRFIGKAGVNDLLHMIFRVPDSLPVAEIRDEMAQLECCHTDEQLFDLAIAASWNGKTKWLNEVVEKDQMSNLVWRRQRARILAGFAIDNALPMSDAWPEGELKTSDARLTRISARFKSIEACARHWWRAYRDASDPVGAYASWVLFLRSADRRSGLWMEKEMVTAGESDNFQRLKRLHAHLNRKNLERAMKKREEKFSQNFLFRKIGQDIRPWI